MVELFTDGRWPRNPVVVAAEAGDCAEVERLAAAGEELSEPDANDETPFWVARRNLKMVELLLTLKADPTVWAGVYYAPIIYCEPNSEIGKLLKRFGFEPQGSSPHISF
jgi:hypothetical protein